MIQYNNMCEYFCDNRYSLIINFLSTIIGVSLGFGFALVIYWLGNRKARRNKEKTEKEKAFNTLKRFSLLLKSVIKTCKEQNTSFNTHSKDLIRKPLDIHLPQLHATNDRDRLVESDDIELYYSFMLYDKSNKDKFRDYKNIFNHADFLQKNYTDLFIQNEKHQNFLHSDSKAIRDNLLAIAIRIGLMQKDIQMNEFNYVNNKTFIFLDKYRNIFINLKSKDFVDMEPYRDLFIIPMELELFENISDQKYANEIAFNLSSASILMENIVENTVAHAVDFKDLNEDKNIISALDYLETIREKISDINKP